MDPGHTLVEGTRTHLSTITQKSLKKVFGEHDEISTSSN